MKQLDKLLEGGDLRSIGNSEKVVALVRGQQEFDHLFRLLKHADRIVVMRAADALEKVSVHHPEYLQSHADEFYHLLDMAVHKELKWHLALMASRISWRSSHLRFVCNILERWVLNSTESNIVRVNSIQGLYNLAQLSAYAKKKYQALIPKLKGNLAPSIRARLKKLNS